MRKLIILCHLSLDGIAAIPSGELNWISYTDEIAKHTEPIVAATDTAVYGPKTFEMMKYWRTVLTDPKASQHDLDHAKWIEDVEKIVFSHSQVNNDWNNTKVLNGDLKEELLKLKNRSGKNITVFGSPRLANSIIKTGLVDELQLTISPVALGSGTYLFEGIPEYLKLKLIEQKTFASGAMAVHYALR